MHSREEGFMNLLGEGTSFNGTMNVKGSIRIDGECEGKFHILDTLIVGKPGRVKGEVRAKQAVIGGKVEGKLFATNRVEFQAGASIEGDLVCKLLVIEEGATFDGSCKMGEEELKDARMESSKEAPPPEETPK